MLTRSPTSATQSWPRPGSGLHFERNERGTADYADYADNSRNELNVSAYHRSSLPRLVRTFVYADHTLIWLDTQIHPCHQQHPPHLEKPRDSRRPQEKEAARIAGSGPLVQIRKRPARYGTFTPPVALYTGAMSEPKNSNDASATTSRLASAATSSAVKSLPPAPNTVGSDGSPVTVAKI